MKKNIHHIKNISLFIIYLMVSLIFVSANSLAMLNYQISGSNNIPGFANANSDSIKINVNADSNVSFVVPSTGQTIPLACLNNGSGMVCNYYFQPSDININLGTITFQLQQNPGVPQSVTGSLKIDSMAPIQNYFIATRINNGLLFNYSFTDYLHDTSEQPCLGSGIGRVAILVNGQVVQNTLINASNCSVSGAFFASLNNTFSDNVYYGFIIADRVGNEFDSDMMNMSGDFKAPTIDDGFTITSGGNELDTFSSTGDVISNIIVTAEDTNLATVSGDLSSLNSNPRYSIQYKHSQASCSKSGNVYTCTFSGIHVMPSQNSINVTITSTDTDGNIATKTLSRTISLENNAGSVLYIGPDKSHCTSDLSQCFTKSGPQIFLTELSPDSSYNTSVINLGIDTDKTFGICHFDTDWKCISLYTVNSSSSINMFLATSHDDFGNPLESDITRTVNVDDNAPKNLSGLTSDTKCPVTGDDMTLNVSVHESESPSLRMYVNSSTFSTDDNQTGDCERQSGDDWECSLTLKDFVSTYVPSHTVPVTISDLAGNTLSMDYNFEVCQANSNSVPNVISQISADPSNLMLDERTMSIKAIRTFIPLQVTTNGRAQIYDWSVDRCTAVSDDGQNMIQSTGYVINSDQPTLVLDIGGVPGYVQSSLGVNCTLSAQIRQGSYVFTQPEKEQISFNISTFSQPLGTADKAASDKIIAEKNHINDLESSIKTYKGIDNIFGTLCDIADTIVKINGLLQALKTVLYGVALVVEAILPGVGDTVWKASIPLTAFDTFTQSYIWPTGFTSGSPYGYIIKYSCILYTCQLYTFQGLINTATDIQTLSNQVSQNRANTVQSSDDGNVHTEKKYDANGDLVSTTVSTKDASGSITKTTIYDNNDNMILATSYDKDGSSTTTDASGRILEATTPDGSFVNYERDSNGKIISRVVYDASSGEVVNALTDSNGKITSVQSVNYVGSGQAQYDKALGSFSDMYPNYQADLKLLAQYKTDLPQYQADLKQLQSGDNSYAEEKAAFDSKYGKYDEIINNGMVSGEITPPNPTDYGVTGPSTSQQAGNTVTNPDQTAVLPANIPSFPIKSSALSQADSSATAKSTTEAVAGVKYTYSPTDKVYYNSADATAASSTIALVPNPDYVFGGTSPQYYTYTKQSDGTWSLTYTNFDQQLSQQYFPAQHTLAATALSKIPGLSSIQSIPSELQFNGVTFERQDTTFSKDGGTVYQGTNGEYYNYKQTSSGSYQLVPISQAQTVSVTSLSMAGNGNTWQSTVQKAMILGVGFGRIVSTSPLNPALTSSALTVVPHVVYDINGNVVSSGITGHATNTVSGQCVGGGTDCLPSPITQAVSQYGQGVSQRDARFYSDLSSNKWIINPYKSWYYDDLCAPAILYNMQKERQLDCMYVSCMQTQLAAGQPTTGCEQRQAFYTCLYLDSAEYKFSDNLFTSVIIPGLLKAGLVYATNVGIQLGYTAICSDYKNAYAGSTPSNAEKTTLASGWYDVGCGALGVFLQYNELKTIFSPSKWKSYFGSERPGDPAAQKDYCIGIEGI